MACVCTHLQQHGHWQQMTELKYDQNDITQNWTNVVWGENIYYGGYIFSITGLFACLSVCLSVCSVTQKVMNWLRWNFMEGFGVIKWTSDSILQVIWVFLDELMCKKHYTGGNDLPRPRRSELTECFV